VGVSGDRAGNRGGCDAGAGGAGGGDCCHVQHAGSGKHTAGNLCGYSPRNSSNERRNKRQDAERSGVPAGRSGGAFRRSRGKMRLSQDLLGAATFQDSLVRETTLVIVYSELLHISEDSGMSVEDEVRCPTSGYSIDMSARQRPGDGRRGEQQHAHVDSKV
jgi:hypothetical protein